MRPYPFAKFFIWVCICAIVVFIYAILFHSTKHPTDLDQADRIWELKTEVKRTEENNRTEVKGEDNLVHEDLKYLLQWTPGDKSPFHFMGKGRSAFLKNNCEYTNCFVTDDRNYFIDQKEFDAVAFNGRQIIGFSAKDLPKVRGLQQKFIFADMESSHYNPMCTPLFDNYFNWTWTYRLDSDVRWGYVTVYDLTGQKVGPSEDVEWRESLEPISENLKDTLSSKTKAVAWFVSNCRSKSKREDLALEMQIELSKYDLVVDVYGNCGKFNCPRNKSKECNKILAKDYYFYLSFENSFAKDYVTEKLFTALDNFAVPVVFGAANYSRFLPPGSYLNARELGVKELASTIHRIIQEESKETYHDFFRWRNYYYYKVTSESDDVCNLCALLNDQRKFKSFSVYEDFRQWWNPPDIDDLCR